MNDPSEPSKDSERAALVLLVVRCQLGERDALDQLVVDWHAAVQRYVGSFLSDQGEIHEVCQEVWLGVLRGLPRLQSRESFAPWLFGIARRSALDCLRQRYRRTPEEVWAENEEVVADVGAAPSRSLDPRELAAGLDTLAPLEREVIVLHYLQELSVEEVSAATGAPTGTVKSRLHRARRKLRAQLGDPNHE